MPNITTSSVFSTTDCPVGSSKSGCGNNEDVPIPLHVSMSIVSLAIFLLSMQQLCGASMDSPTIKYRAGVACSCFTFLIVSIALNFELAQDAEQIDIADTFVLIVRTLMVLWTFIIFVLAYWFVVHAVRAAYKATQGINKVEAPAWIQKFWFVVICVEEIILFLCYVFAFATMDILPWKIFILSTFVIAVVGSGIALGSLIDVQLSIRQATHKAQRAVKHGNNNPQARHLKHEVDREQQKRIKYGQRILRAITVFTIGIIIGSLWNIYLLVNNLAMDQEQKPGSLRSRILDNIEDYLSYMFILDFINLALLFWTYKPHAINYCCFCCDYKRYATEAYRDTDIDPSVLCFLCCGGLIETADDKRQTIIDRLPVPTLTNGTGMNDPENPNPNGNNNNQNGNQHIPRGNTEIGLANQIETQKLRSAGSGRSSNTGNQRGLHRKSTDPTAADPDDLRAGVNRMPSQVETRIRVVIYEFDGVLTGEHYRVFEHRTIETIGSMPFDSVSFHFGGRERVISLRDHFKKLFDQGVKMYVVSKEETGKLYAILKKLDIVQFFMKIQHSSRLSNNSSNNNRGNPYNNNNNDNDNNENNETLKKEQREDMHYFERTLKDEDHNRALMYGIIGCDNPVMQKVKGNLKGFILKLIQLKSRATLINDEILFVSTDMNLTDHFKEINLCRALKIESIGLNDNDCQEIEKRA